MVRVDQLCFQNNIKFFCGDVYGYYGYMFCNLGQEYHYIEEKPKVVKPSGDSKDGPEPKRAKVDPNETTVVKKTVRFCTLKEALEVDWRSEKARAALKRTPLDYFLLLGMESQKKIQKISRNSERMFLCLVILFLFVRSYCFSEMSPVCAVVGGVLGQEVVKALSQRDAPHRNFFFFDARKGNGMVDFFGPD
uniref:SUMO1 activating enzyme subunit 1 n=1 Tax=Nothobranchius furzeri TaxID=105023 RepID=A0A8C6LFD1_NOTFU